MGEQTDIFQATGEVEQKGIIRKFTLREMRAIANATKRYNYVPALSIYPKVNFVSRDTGSRISMDIGDVLATYDNDRKEASKERARAKERKPKGYRQMYD